MVSVPGFCPTCGHTFAAESIIQVAPGVTGISISNVGTDCPRCGSLSARLIDGRFDVTDQSEFVLHDAPEWTVDTLRSLGRDFVRILEDPPDDFTEQIEQRLPHDLRSAWRSAVTRLNESQTLQLARTIATILGGVAVAPEAAGVVRTTVLWVLKFVKAEGRLPW